MANKWEMLCDACEKEEHFLLKGDLLIFDCGHQRDMTPVDLKILFRRFGGDR